MSKIKVSMLAVSGLLFGGLVIAAANERPVEKAEIARVAQAEHEQRTAAKAEADRVAAAAKAEADAKRAADQAERAARRAADQAERAARRAADQAERDAKRAAEKAEAERKAAELNKDTARYVLQHKGVKCEETGISDRKPVNVLPGFVPIAKGESIMITCANGQVYAVFKGEMEGKGSFWLARFNRLTNTFDVI